MEREKGNTDRDSRSLDWLIGGILSKLGDTFDRITGRNWNPSSSLATSKLIEKLHLLMDAEVRDLGSDGRFVPHVFRLKIQWNKFSTDSDLELGKLENELKAAAIDHINDRLYHTFAPLDISVVKDYFVEGVQFTAGFGDFADSEEDEVAVHVTLANIPVGEAGEESVPKESPDVAEPEARRAVCTLSFTVKGKPVSRKLEFGDKQRFSVGRTGSNDIVIDDDSISKSHASIAASGDGRVLVADTGSTNGTFIGSSRMAYGKAVEVEDGASVRFGNVEVVVRIESAEGLAGQTVGSPSEAPAVTEVIEVPDTNEPAPTLPSVGIETDDPDSKPEDDWEI